MTQRLSPRENQVRFDLSGETPPKDAVEFFEENGFVVFGEVFTEGERQQLLDEMDNVFNQLSPDHEDVTAGTGPDGSPRAGRIYHLMTHSERIRDLAQDVRIQAIRTLCPGAGTLLDSHRSGVLYQEKRPNPGSGFKGLKWHDDYETPESGRTLTVGIYLDHSTQANGAMRVVPGTQNAGSERIPKDTDVHPEEIAIVANPGDVTAHISGLWHCSPVGWLEAGPEAHRRVLYIGFSELADLEGLPDDVPEGYRDAVDIR